MSLLLQVSRLESLCWSLGSAAEAGWFIINRNCIKMICTSSAGLISTCNWQKEEESEQLSGINYGKDFLASPHLQSLSSWRDQRPVCRGR